MDHKYGSCTCQREQPGAPENIIFAILWVFVIKQLFHLYLLEMKYLTYHLIS